MKSRYLACTIAFAALATAGTDAIAQTASVPARRLFLYDGGTAATLNRITLQSPLDASLTGNYGLTLPSAQGNVNDIMFVQSKTGNEHFLEFTNGSPLFWRVVGNDHAIVDGTNNLFGTLAGTDQRVRFMTNGNLNMVMGNSADNYNFSIGGILPDANRKLQIDWTTGAGPAIGLGTNIVYTGGGVANAIGVYGLATGNGDNTYGLRGSAIYNGAGSGITTKTVGLYGSAGNGGQDILALGGELYATDADAGNGYNVGVLAYARNANTSIGLGAAAGASDAQLGTFVATLPAGTYGAVVYNPDAAGVGAVISSAFEGLRIDAPDAGIIIGTNTAPNTGIDVRATTAGILVGGALGTPIVGVNVNATATAFQATNATTSFDGDGNTLLGDDNGDSHTIVGSFDVNATPGQTAATTIGQTTDGGAIILAANNDITVDVGATTNNLILNNIASNAAIEDVLWITGVGNEVRRTPFSGLVEQGITFNNEGGVTRLRLGGLANTDNPLLANRFVNLDNFSLTYTRNGGADNLLVLDGSSGDVTANTTNTTVNATNDVDVTATNALTLTTTNSTLAISSGADVDVDATTAVTIDAGTNIELTATGDVTIDGVNITSTGTTTISNTAPNVNVNTTGTGATTIGSTATGGTVNINASAASPITIDVAATTNNLVLNNILADVITDDLLWITAANQVRRQPASSTADEGIVFTNGAYRLGSTIVGNGAGSNPFDVNRTVNLDNFSLTFNRGAAADAMLTIDASTDALSIDVATASIQGSTSIDMDAPAITINDNGTGSTQIGNATAGTLTLQSASTITATAGTTLDLNAADIDADATASIALDAATTLTATGGTGVTVTATTNDLTLAASAGLLTGTGSTGVGLTATTNDVTIGATAGQIVLNAGTNVDVNATGNVTVDGVDITETASGTYSLSAPTANINTGTASTTNIGNTTNGIVNIAGNGDNGVTITGAQAAPGNNTIVMEIGNAASNLVINNIAVVNPIEDLLWITAANEVRRTPFSGTANEGIQFENSAYRLGANAIDVNPIVSTRIATIGAAGTLSFQTATGTNNMLQLNNNGDVTISSVGGGATTIGSNAAGAIGLESASTITATAGTTLDLNAADIDADATATIDLAAGSTFAATGATGLTLTATANNAVLEATANDVEINAGTDVVVTATNNVDINGVDITNTAGGAFSATATTTAEVIGGTGTTVEATTGTLTLNAADAAGDVDIDAGDAVTIDGTTISLTAAGGDATITVPGGASGNDLRLVGIDVDATPTQMLTLTATDEVRRTDLAGTALEGLVWSTGAYRLGTPTAGNGAGTNPLLGNRFVNLDGNTLAFNRGAGSDNMLTINGGTDAINVDAASVDVLGTTSINTTGTATTSIGSGTAGAVSAASASTVTLTAGTTLDMNGASVDVDATGALTLDGGSTATLTGATGTSVIATTGNVAVTASAGNVNVTATGAGNDIDLTAPDDVRVVAAQLVVNTGPNPNLRIREDNIDRNGALSITAGANQIQIGNTGGTVLLNGVSGTPNLTATSLASNGAPAFSQVNDGIVVADNTGLLRRRPVTDLINANEGLTYNEDATANVQMGSTTNGNGAITTNRFVRVSGAGVLTFNSSATNPMLVLSNTGNVTISGGNGNTAIGNATGTFGVTSNQLNVNSTNGNISDAVGAVTVNDAEGLVVDQDGNPINDLSIAEAGLTRTSLDIAINPGASNRVTTNGSAEIAVNLNVLGSTTLGDGNDGFAVNSGTGLAQINSTNEVRITGPTNINTTSSVATSIGNSAAGSAQVSIQSGSNVNIQTAGDGDVQIGNNPAQNVLTVNAEVRGAGANRFAERVTIAGTGVANYLVNNTLVRTGSVILVTVENYTGAGILSYEITNRTANTNFEVTFSNVVLAGENVTINYMIINP